MTSSFAEEHQAAAEQGQVGENANVGEGDQSVSDEEATLFDEERGRTHDASRAPYRFHRGAGAAPL